MEYLQGVVGITGRLTRSQSPDPEGLRNAIEEASERRAPTVKPDGSAATSTTANSNFTGAGIQTASAAPPPVRTVSGAASGKLTTI